MDGAPPQELELAHLIVESLNLEGLNSEEIGALAMTACKRPMGSGTSAPNQPVRMTSS
jgi:hypothetical protein